MTPGQLCLPISEDGDSIASTRHVDLSCGLGKTRNRSITAL